MNITYIAAGAAGSYCGACMRDVVLARGLTARGHDVQLLPMYTPLRADGPDVSADRVFLGGINAYLQDKSAIFRHTPAFLDRLLDNRLLLKLVSRFAIKTRPQDLGGMTVSVLRGPDGRQRKEVDKVVRYLEECPRPDVINLTNSLLSGLVPAMRERLDVPLVCTLQGEESFIGEFDEPHRSQAIDLLRQHARAIDLFIAQGEAHADEMTEFLAVEPERIQVVRPGVDLELYSEPEARAREPFRIGYLSRIAPEKGLDVLCDAFRIIEARRPGQAILCIAGEIRGPNKLFWKSLRADLDRHGLLDRVEYVGAPDGPEKVRFLRSCSIFAVPSRLPERRAMAWLEAMAAGLPVVAPDRGVFPEIVSLTGGGVVVPTDTPEALADATSKLQDDPDQADRLGRSARAGVVEHFSGDRMVTDTLAAYEKLIAVS